jgi:hypothetical protein
MSTAYGTWYQLNSFFTCTSHKLPDGPRILYRKKQGEKVIEIFSWYVHRRNTLVSSCGIYIYTSFKYILVFLLYLFKVPRFVFLSCICLNWLIYFSIFDWMLVCGWGRHTTVPHKMCVEVVYRRIDGAVAGQLPTNSRILGRRSHIHARRLMVAHTCAKTNRGRHSRRAYAPCIGECVGTHANCRHWMVRLTILL